MSEVIHAPQHCDDCDRDVKLRKKQNRQLIVACACESVDVKVSTVTPGSWEQ